MKNTYRILFLTYLYIDKNMVNHNLFQAIYRVSRVNGEEKDYGYIIDYQDLFNSIASSIKDYTTEAFEEYDWFLPNP